MSRKYLPNKTRAAIYKRDNYICGICGTAILPSDLEIDHITPLFTGGTNDESNLRATHKLCNRGRDRHYQQPPSGIKVGAKARVITGQFSGMTGTVTMVYLRKQKALVWFNHNASVLVSWDDVVAVTIA